MEHPPLIALSIKPAWLLVYAFGGGPHSDVSGKWWYQGPALATPIESPGP